MEEEYLRFDMFWDHVKRWWSLYGVVVLTIAISELQFLQTVIKDNPKLSMLIAMLLIALAKVSKSPKQ